MPELAFETIVARPRAEVWAQMRDLRVAKHYVPGVTVIEYSTTQHEGVGASRKVYMARRAPVDETAIAWEDGRGFTLRIHNGVKSAAPFRWATFKYEIADAPDGHTVIRGVFAYEMGLGLFGRILDALVIRRSIERTNAALRTSMKKFYESGQASRPTVA